jgi:hypothetical protein
MEEKIDKHKDNERSQVYFLENIFNSVLHRKFSSQTLNAFNWTWRLPSHFIPKMCADSLEGMFSGEDL